MNCSYWGSNKLPHDPLLSAFYRHREAQSNSSSGIRCMPGAYRCPPIGFTQASSSPGHPCCSSNRFQSSAGQKAPTSGLQFPTQYTWRFSAYVPSELLVEKYAPSVLSPKASSRACCKGRGIAFERNIGFGKLSSKVKPSFCTHQWERTNPLISLGWASSSSPYHGKDSFRVIMALNKVAYHRRHFANCQLLYKLSSACCISM